MKPNFIVPYGQPQNETPIGFMARFEDPTTGHAALLPAMEGVASCHLRAGECDEYPNGVVLAGLVVDGGLNSDGRAAAQADAADNWGVIPEENRLTQDRYQELWDEFSVHGDNPWLRDDDIDTTGGSD